MSAMASFLQSPEWHDIQERNGRKVHCEHIGKEVIRFVEHSLPFGFFYYYAPRPVIHDVGKFFALAERMKKNSRALFFRVEPERKIDFAASPFPIRRGAPVQPAETVRVDVTQEDEALLAAMHPKMRYNVRLAERRGVCVEIARGSEVMEHFYTLLRETAERNAFTLHPRTHYEYLLERQSGDFSNELYLARWNGHIAAAALVNFYGGTATYLHGGSARSFGAVMAPHLLHWNIIREVRARGCRTYDLWGIDEARWPSLSRFKRGLGGAVARYPGAYDLVFQPFGYQLYQFLRRLQIARVLSG